VQTVRQPYSNPLVMQNETHWITSCLSFCVSFFPHQQILVLTDSSLLTCKLRNTCFSIMYYVKFNSLARFHGCYNAIKKDCTSCQGGRWAECGNTITWYLHQTNSVLFGEAPSEGVSPSSADFFTTTYIYIRLPRPTQGTC
jgi:hypothetical protein